MAKMTKWRAFVGDNGRTFYERSLYLSDTTYRAIVLCSERNDYSFRVVKNSDPSNPIVDAPAPTLTQAKRDATQRLTWLRDGEPDTTIGYEHP